MIAVLRRFIIIGILFGIILFIQSIQVESLSGINPKTLAALGFIILASFTLGEIFSFIKLPRVIGYLLIGIIFGPYSADLINTNILSVLNFSVIKNLNLVNNVTLSIIALTAGMELHLSGLKKSIKSISYILLFKVVFTFITITAFVFLLSPYINFLADAHWKIILAAGLILSVISLGTSIELTLVVADEAQAKGKFIDLILSTAIVKDVLVILLLAVLLTISAILVNPTGGLDLIIFLDLAKELLFSVIVGAGLGGILILYLKYVSKELVLFILAFVVFGSELSHVLHLETLVVFLSAGIILQNFSEFGEKFHHPLQKLSLPIFIVFFTVAGTSINFVVLRDVILIGVALALVRAVALYYSVNIAGKITQEGDDVKKYGWLGFLSIGGLMLGLSIVISEKLPGLGENIKSIITSIVALNIFAGPVLLKLAINKSKKYSTEPEVEKDTSENLELKKSISKIITDIKKQTTEAKFNEPDFEDERINKSLYQLIFNLNSILESFDKKFIYNRSEESLELIIGITERYIDTYNTIKSSINKPGVNINAIQHSMVQAKKELSNWYIDLCAEHKTIEKNILQLEPLIKELFFSLTDLTDGLQTEYLVDLENERVIINSDDSVVIKFKKFYLKSKLSLRNLFDKEYKLKRIIPYKNLAKYHLVGTSANEILETVNLVGNERLTTLRQIRNIYNDNLKYFNELLQLTQRADVNNTSISEVLIKFEEVHANIINELKIYRTEINNTSQEISRRLRYALVNPFNNLLLSLKTAGTSEANETKIKYSKIFAKSENRKDEALETIRYWVNYYVGFLGLFEKEIRIEKLKLESLEIVDNLLLSISDEININLRNVIEELLKNIDNFKTQLASSEHHNKIKLVELIDKSYLDEFTKSLEEYIKDLEDLKRSKKLNMLIENLRVKFSELAHNLPETISLIEESQIKFKDRKPFFINLKQVQIQKVAISILDRKLPREIGEINEMLINHLEITLYELKNFFSIINFHINAAKKEIQTESESGIKIAYDLIDFLSDKLNFRVKQLNEQVNRLELNINGKIASKVDGIISEINKLIIDGSLLSMKIYMEKETGRIVASVIVKKYASLLLYQFKKTRVLSTKFYNKFLKRSLVDIAIKLKLKQDYEEDSISDYLFLDEEKLNSLPFIYRKLFDGLPLESGDFFIGQNEILQKVEFGLKRFYEQKPSSIIIIGEPGSGKRSLINSIKNNLLHDIEYINYQFKNTITSADKLLTILSEQIGLEKKASAEELIIYLNDHSQKKIIILEALSKLYFKKINGFEALKTFAYIVSSTNNNTFWICSIGKYGWGFIKNNFDLNNIYSTKLYTSELHQKDIKNIVLKRHNATGFNLKFLPNDIQKLKSKIIKAKSYDDEQKELSGKYFEKLEQYSEGNIISAMYYWLQSIDSVKGNDILIRPPRKIILGFLSKLDDIYLLSISSILTHGWLKDKEHAKLFNITLNESREILNYLVSIKLINFDADDMETKKYFINKFVYKAIENELIKRNMN